MTARKFVIKIIKYNDIQHNDNETNNDNINQGKNNNNNNYKDNNDDEIMTKTKLINRNDK